MALSTTKQRKAIGERLMFERQRLGFTQLQIAQLLGVKLETYIEMEEGKVDPGLFALPRLSACGFDIGYIAIDERFHPLEDENELLHRFRELSAKGKSSIFMTLDALERLAPNIRTNIRKTLKEKLGDRFKLD